MSEHSGSIRFARNTCYYRAQAKNGKYGCAACAFGSPYGCMAAISYAHGLTDSLFPCQAINRLDATEVVWLLEKEEPCQK